MYVNKRNIKKDYMSGLKYKEIQDKYNITNSQLIYLIRKNKWKRENNRSKALKNNKNAKGNKGGPGAEKKNKRALKTGEYEDIFSSCFSEAEKQIFETDEFDKTAELIFELKVLKVRESRMLNRIEELQKNKKDMVINNISKSNVQNSNAKWNDSTTTYTHAENTIVAIQRIEDGLTRVQEAKRRCIESLNKAGVDSVRIEIEKEKLSIEKKRLELELQNAEGEEIEDTSETDRDIYGSD